MEYGVVNNMDIKIKKIKDGKLPTYESEGAAGADCYARIDETIMLQAGDIITIPLGFAVELPEGYEMQIRGRSGLARKNGIMGFIGTIDSDYRGEVSAILFNTSKKSFEINPGDRIAQAVVAPVMKANWIVSDKLSETKRGEGGFGSTGISKKETFYEPFKNTDTDVEEAKKLIGKEVIIDDSINGKIRSVFETKEIIKAYYIDIDIDKGQDFFGLDFADFTFVEAFQRVKVDGHRFGKEIEFES